MIRYSEGRVNRIFGVILEVEYYAESLRLLPAGSGNLPIRRETGAQVSGGVYPYEETGAGSVGTPSFSWTGEGQITHRIQTNLQAFGGLSAKGRLVLFAP